MDITLNNEQLCGITLNTDIEYQSQVQSRYYIKLITVSYRIYHSQCGNLYAIITYTETSQNYIF